MQAIYGAKVTAKMLRAAKMNKKKVRTSQLTATSPLLDGMLNT